MFKYQVTLFSKSGKYKPISAIVTYDAKLATNNRTDIIKQGAEKICHARYWDKKDLARYEYTTVKVRLYDPEKIAQEAAGRYERIKQEKYVCGEWKAPKRKR